MMLLEERLLISQPFQHLNPCTQCFVRLLCLSVCLAPPLPRYHCHTCKMVDGVGVCTVCAKVCHKDHEISYAKYGSFFCDCGAKEDGSCQVRPNTSGHHGKRTTAVTLACKSLLPPPLLHLTSIHPLISPRVGVSLCVCWPVRLAEKME